MQRYKIRCNFWYKTGKKAGKIKGFFIEILKVVWMCGDVQKNGNASPDDTADIDISFSKKGRHYSILKLLVSFKLTSSFKQIFIKKQRRSSFQVVLFVSIVSCYLILVGRPLSSTAPPVDLR